MRVRIYVREEREPAHVMEFPEGTSLSNAFLVSMASLTGEQQKNVVSVAFDQDDFNAR